VLPASPSAEHGERGAHVDVVRLEEDDRLGEQLKVPGDDQLVGGLDGLAAPGGPDVYDGATHHLQQWAGELDVRSLAPDHDRQFCLDGAGLSAADRCVDDPQPVLGAGLSQAASGVGTDRGAVDVQRPGLGVAVEPVVAVGDVFDVGAVRDHRDDDLGLGDRRSEAGGCPAAAL